MNVEERIAEVARKHRLTASSAFRDGKQCECGWRSTEAYATWTDHPEHLAAAITELIRDMAARGELLRSLDALRRDPPPLATRARELVDFHSAVGGWGQRQTGQAGELLLALAERVEALEGK